ncbi:hypothetical protein FACS1894130_10810 [Spirochaetia bacterium]|nr:hypothetical protein FACS1894130_10810 [Spirochaetia bacterium]
MHTNFKIIILMLCFVQYVNAQVIDENGFIVQPYRRNGFEQTGSLFANGYYYMLDYPVNIRAEPGLKGNIIGKLGMNDKIEILENTEKLQIIENVLAFWYKIKFNNIVGYIWGGYIAEQTLIVDIDNNGILDYFHVRVSRVSYLYNERHGPKDTFIYINNQKIDTSGFAKITPQGIRDEWWAGCRINKFEDVIRFNYSSDYIIDIFDVNKFGEITYRGNNAHEVRLGQ